MLLALMQPTLLFSARNGAYWLKLQFPGKVNCSYVELRALGP